MGTFQEFPIMFATWSNSSNILNCIIESRWLQNSTNVSVETDYVIVSKGQSEYKILLSGITLEPDTCRGLKLVSGRELHFSIKGELTEGNDMLPVKIKKCSLQNETVETIEKLQNKWFCAVCKQKVLTDRSILSRVLPLPSENWSDLADMWFCHNHGNEDQSTQKQGRLLPKDNECFVGETYVLVARKHVNNTEIKLTKSGAVKCKRCGRQLGEVIHNENGVSSQDMIVKFFLHTLLMKDLRYADLIKADTSIHNRVDLSRFFSGLLQEQSEMYASFRFIIESRPETVTESTQSSTSTCLLWMLDSNVQMYRSRSHLWSRRSRSDSGTRSDDKIIVNPTGVSKVLFKCQICGSNAKRTPDHMTKSLVSLWRKDNTVHCFQLPHPVFLQLIHLLIQNCKQLPCSQRYLNSFHVSFIQNSETT